MPRRNRKPIATVEAQARAKYLLARNLPGTDWVITDAGLWPVRGSAGLRAASDVALVVELGASLVEVDKP